MHKKFSNRLIEIQKTIGVVQTGKIDIDTCIAIEQRLNINVVEAKLDLHIQAIQKRLIVNIDCIIGSQTLTAIEQLLSTFKPTSKNVDLTISKRSFNSIIELEVSSEKTYNKKYKSPIWAGGYSGITIGIGYDCGYCNQNEFLSIWQKHLSPNHVPLLLRVCGKKGPKCKQFRPALKEIIIPYALAVRRFHDTVLPTCSNDVCTIYPGIEQLPPDAQGAILSLVYNRGPLINNTDRRKEMKVMIPLIAKGDTEGIAAQLRSMKRLWDPKKQKGLIDRREYEAQLVENASFDFLPEEIVIV